MKIKYTSTYTEVIKLMDWQGEEVMLDPAYPEMDLDQGLAEAILNKYPNSFSEVVSTKRGKADDA